MSDEKSTFKKKFVHMIVNEKYHYRGVLLEDTSDGWLINDFLSGEKYVSKNNRIILEPLDTFDKLKMRQVQLRKAAQNETIGDRIRREAEELDKSIIAWQNKNVDDWNKLFPGFKIKPVEEA